MSRPSNRLAEFRSYSYYHVLAMCDSSETAQALAASNDLGVWERSSQPAPVDDNRPFLEDLGRYAPRQIEGKGRYIILINGSTDAAFSITSAKWMCATGATAVPDDRSTSLAVEGSIQISEPKGVAFLDQMVKCAVALGVDSAQVYYVMKTFFIGFRDDEQAASGDGYRYDFISDIPPITFIVYDVSGVFTEAGGSYEMNFVAAAHGASRLPQYSKAVQNMSITAGDSLEQTFKRLEDNINRSYEQYYNCVYEQVKTMAQGNEDVLRALRRVKYVIDVGPDYSDAAGIKYTVTNQPQQFKNAAGCNEPATVNFQANTSIEGAIRTIMQMCPQVQADMATGDEATKAKYEFKIHTALLSRQAEGEARGVLDYTVYYRVERFLTPKAISYSPAFSILQEDISEEQANNDPNFQLIKRNIIEFDYMYTGKNIDILEFDMKVNSGMAYLQTATLANSFKGQLQRAPTRQMQVATQDANSHLVRFGSIVQTPVFFGSHIRTPVLQTAQNPADAIQSAYTLSKHASIEVTDVSMRIVGNTKLLGTTNQITSPEVVAQRADGDTALRGPAEATFTDWTFVPAYARVNIKMPRNNDDFLLYTGQGSDGTVGSTDYARNFWFDGYYYVVAIENEFTNGEFTQVLSMLGLPKRSAFASTQSTAPEEVTPKTTAGSCFDNQIGAGPSPNSPAGEKPSEAPPAVPHVPPSGTTEPTNKADADTANRTARSPSDVRGWDQASPEVKTAILRASEAYGVDPVVMAQFASKESSFDPKAAAAPSSSATGLFQFLRGTWNGLVSQGKVKEVKTLATKETQAGSGANWSKPLPSDPRMDAQANAYAGAAFLKENARIIGSNDAGDLYLAHFLGPGDAQKVIARDNATGGNELLSVALGSKQAAAIARANPRIVRPNSTVGEIRSWAARDMAKLLNNPIPVARKTAPTATTGTGGQAQVSPSTENSKRTADKPVAAVQNARVQSEAKDKQPCAPLPNKTPQDTNKG